MLPHSNYESKSNKTIYINPNFKGQLQTPENTPLQPTNIIPWNAHINPLFLKTRKYTIHMNPAFLQKFQDSQKQQNIQKKLPENGPKSSTLNQTTDIIGSNPLFVKSISTETRKIICKSKNCLIREPLIKNMENSIKLTKPSFALQPLLVLSKRKLVRKVTAQSTNPPESIGFNDFKTRITKYKLDNRLITKKPLLPPTPKIKRISFIGRYALKRNSFTETSNTSSNKSLSFAEHKKAHVLNINGLLYKSTRNTLKLKGITSRTLKSSDQNAMNEKPSSNTNQGLTIFVRGNKYVMDANKFKLTRVKSCDRLYSNAKTRSNSSFKAPTCQRIDIGGYTYVSMNSAKNVLIRTTNHLSRAYVHNAKQKSLQMLTKRLAKTNIPCPIFQRIGKCAAFERGKCFKVHNKLQIAICNKFLRGECLDSNCLLSHNVSLSKMPVCKFYLQGVCVRNDCPYLHKKLSHTAELCTEFLRGFCKMADKCNKRHEFVCPEVERNNKCITKNCLYCNAKKRKESQMNLKSAKFKNENTNPSTLFTTSNSMENTENQSCKRYFIDSCEKRNESEQNCKNEDIANNMDVTEHFEENSEKSHETRPKLGTLPAYIPL